ncbi:MAG: hypothetical protein GY861_14855 [bacterium]|nr:hypothetical protein [bacterium]
MTIDYSQQKVASKYIADLDGVAGDLLYSYEILGPEGPPSEIEDVAFEILAEFFNRGGNKSEATPKQIEGVYNAITLLHNNTRFFSKS